MVRSCSAFNCTNRDGGSRNNNGKAITFHRFPLRNKKVCSEWVAAIRRQDFHPNQHHVVCSCHFKESDFLPGYVNRRQLKDDSEPSVFNFPPHLQKLQKGRKPPCLRNQKVEDVVLMPEDGVTPGTSNDNHQDHHYALPSSPQKLKRKYEEIVTRKETAVQKQRENMKLIKKKCVQRDKKIGKLEDLLQQLKERKLIDDDISSILLSTCDSDVFFEIMRRSKTSRKEYSNTLKSFALTLNFHSPAAYRFVRETFNNLLPHGSTLHRWYSTIDGSPGFTSEAFQILKERVEAELPKKTLCVLMSIRKEFEWSGNQFLGYVDFGPVCTKEGLEGKVAKEALVLMAVAINSHWKVPIGYFLVDGVSGEMKRNFIEIALKMLHDINVIVPAVTCDGLQSNVSMAKSLGADLRVDNMKPFFPHPVTSDNVYIIFDACHMIKLIHNTLGDLKELTDGSGRRISWQYIENLCDIQEQEGLRLANKLRLVHLNYGQQKMKVKLAVQVLSDSVSTALDYLRCDLHLEQFQGSEATAHFCKMFNTMFDIVNSKNRLGKDYKSPLHEGNHMWEPFIEEMECYLKDRKI